jgi:hypothetical protein
MCASANSSYWWGRISRAYLTSVIWNVMHKRVLLAASRLTYALAGLALAGSHLVSSSFWRAVAKPYASSAFLGELKEANASK